jgi:hypothetical protein
MYRIRPSVAHGPLSRLDGRSNVCPPSSPSFASTWRLLRENNPYMPLNLILVRIMFLTHEPKRRIHAPRSHMGTLECP